ncbi:hypothetical protein PINS_up002268 [Pythium insidiosum]|nr:hypothetical protein PINS_up002268 [Pythium insidiosum]
MSCLKKTQHHRVLAKLGVSAQSHRPVDRRQAGNALLSRQPKLPESPAPKETTKESERLIPVAVGDVGKPYGVTNTNEGRPVVDFTMLQTMSNFATMLSSVAPPSVSEAAIERLDELLDQFTRSEVGNSSRITTLHKIASLISEEAQPFWAANFARVVSALLDAAAERDVNAIRVLQRLVRAQPKQAQEFVQPILLGLLDGIGSQVDLSTHLIELTLIEIVESATSQSVVLLEHLTPLIDSRTPPVLQVILRLVRTALDTAARVSDAHAVQKTQDPEWSNQLLSSLVTKLHHPSSDVRKRAVDCLVAFHFASKESDSLASYLSRHVDPTKQKLIDIFIERRRASASARETLPAAVPDSRVVLMDCSE